MEDSMKDLLKRIGEIQKNKCSDKPKYIDAAKILMFSMFLGFGVRK